MPEPWVCNSNLEYAVGQTADEKCLRAGLPRCVGQRLLHHEPFQPVVYIILRRRPYRHRLRTGLGRRWEDCGCRRHSGILRGRTSITKGVVRWGDLWKELGPTLVPKY